MYGLITQISGITPFSVSKYLFCLMMPITLSLFDICNRLLFSVVFQCTCSLHAFANMHTSNRYLKEFPLNPTARIPSALDHLKIPDKTGKELQHLRENAKTLNKHRNLAELLQDFHTAIASRVFSCLLNFPCTSLVNALRRRNIATFCVFF